MKIFLYLLPLILLFIICALLLIIRKIKSNKHNAEDEDEKYYDENKEDDDLQQVNVNIWKKIIKVVLKKKKNITIMIISVVLLGIVDVITPFVSSKVIETFFGDNPDFTKKWLYIGYYIFAAVMYAVTVRGFVKYAGYTQMDVEYEIRKDAFRKIQELPFSYYDKTPSGWIIARLSSDARKLSEILSWGMLDLSWAAASMIGVMIMIYIINYNLAIILTISAPVILMVAFLFTRMILKAYRNVRKTNSKITAAYSESILGAKTTKTLCLEETRYSEFTSLTSKYKKQALQAVFRSSIFWPITLVIGYIAVATTLNIGTGYIIGEFAGTVITAPVLYLFINYATNFFDPIMAIARVIGDLQQAEAAAERVIGLIETEAEIKDTDEVINIYGDILNKKRENYEPLIGDVEFKNVTFSYTEKEVVLKNFNLKIKAGTSVALVGTTGAGKSTIINLLCRFYEPTKGEILIDGKNYKERSISWLHENLGYVLQTPFLFNGSIKDNIAYGKQDATMEEIIDAAKRAQADEFISKLPNGYDTEVGEGGAKLSLGERQLISFARAILIDPKILILDEATSSIDTSTEVKIQEVMNNFMKGRTTFMVAHRLSTVINSDLILVIKDGEIIEQGNHSELLKLKNVYYNLYKTQFINEGIEKSSK